jgi:competence ComEA-like helix-hairpin-helix protein
LLFTPDERRALIALGGLLALGLLARLAVHEPLPPAGGGDSLLVVLAAEGEVAVDDSASIPPPGLVEEGRVRINEAGLPDLMRLPRVGPRLAERILEARKHDGPFQSLQDLRRVKGIGPKTAALLEPCLSFEAPGAAAADCTERMQPARAPSPPH